MTTPTLVVLAVLLQAPESAETGVLVRLVVKGVPAELSDDERQRVVRRVEALMVGCGVTAESTPDAWDRVLAGPHLYLRLPDPLVTRQRKLKMTEIAIGLQEPNLIGPEMSRHSRKVIGHGKCDGHRALALMCATALRQHLLPGQGENCKVYDRVGEPRESE